MGTIFLYKQPHSLWEAYLWGTAPVSCIATARIPPFIREMTSSLGNMQICAGHSEEEMIIMNRKIQSPPLPANSFFSYAIILRGNQKDGWDCESASFGKTLMSFQITYSLFSVLLTILQYNMYRAEEVIMNLCCSTPVFSTKASVSLSFFFPLCFLKCKIIDNYKKCFWTLIFQRDDQVARLLVNVFGNCFVFTMVLGELHVIC